VKGLAISEGQGFSLAADSERTLCATLTSYARPRPSNQSWRVGRYFTGFTPLNDPDDANVDIVIIPGLCGHALGSFRSANGLSVWPRDFAPEDIPRARFVVYGYETAFDASYSTQGVRELAHTLLDGLAIFRRRTQTQQRPLLFVCHSLGGVVLKEALVISSKAAYKEWLEVVEVTYGLVFMGVPNLSLRYRQLETMVRGQLSEAFIHDLLTGSDGGASQFLEYLTAEFSDLDRRRSLPFVIVSYYETLKSRTIVASIPSVTTKGRTPLTDKHQVKNDERFATEGPYELMVSKMSAHSIGHNIRNTRHLASDTDHKGLVRFEDSEDTNYISMRNSLQLMAMEAPQALQSRVQSGYFGGAMQVGKYLITSVLSLRGIMQRITAAV
jgi:hypothetical protein